MAFSRTEWALVVLALILGVLAGLLVSLTSSSYAGEMATGIAALLGVGLAMRGMTRRP